MTTALSQPVIALTGRLPLVLLLLAHLISHGTYQPTAYLLVLGGFGMLAVYVKPLPALPRYLLIAIGLGAFFLFYRRNFSVEMAGAFLMLAATFKLFELRTVRDLMALVFVSIYASAVSFLFVQSFLHTLLQLAIVLLSLYCLMRIYGGQGQDMGVAWWALLRLFVVALPMVIVCYLFFPRIDPLWSIPVKTSQARSGLSDSMSPGDIISLSQSAERAFRAAFHSVSQPQKEQLYWRGFVLDQFDGKTWTRSSSRQFSGAERIDTGRFTRTPGEDTYEIMLESHFQFWAFGLAGSVPASSNIRQADMGLIELDTEAIQPTRYLLQRIEPPLSSARTELNLAGIQWLPDVARTGASPRFYQDLQVPRRGNPKTREFVSELSRHSGSAFNFVKNLMQHFAQEHFFYTLQPPALGQDFVDDFMFESRRGFCSHYAGSLAFMLRLAGIPARVVLGYQGGEYNQDGGYFIVRQYDAHAWVEAYVAGLGWLQLDPTAMIAPDRIRYGLEAAMREEGSFLADNPFASAAHRYSTLGWIRLRMDELNYQWQKWVVNYNPSQQESLVSALYGATGFKHLGFIFLGLLLGVMGVLYWYLSRTQRTMSSYHARRYLLWCWILARLGAPRSAAETPRAYVARLQREQKPRLAQLAQRAMEHLERHEYRS